MMKGNVGVNFLLKSFVQAVREQSPKLFHECPYFGVHGVTNFSIPNKIVSILPVGLFRVNMTITDETSKPIFIASLLIDVFY